MYFYPLLQGFTLQKDNKVSVTIRKIAVHLHIYPDILSGIPGKRIHTVPVPLLLFGFRNDVPGFIGGKHQFSTVSLSVQRIKICFYR